MIFYLEESVSLNTEDDIDMQAIIGQTKNSEVRSKT